ncbi:MAG: DUF2877 domain-containing protein, partial [Spirochaetales bacterium]|nr:DUF2877 domain-containing protein [Spirochaetales bacterium]
SMQNAITVGAFVPREFSGTVFSVHDHAINIKDDNDHRLISIVDREQDMTGLSILAPRLPTGISRGQRVAIHDDHLSVLATPDGSAAAISLRTSGDFPLFSGSITDALFDVTQATICGQLPVIRNAVLAHGSPVGLRDLVGGPPHPCTGGTAPMQPRPSSVFVRRAFDVIDAIGEAGPSADLSGLVGLGIGFTPSGDDFIMGFLASGAASFGSAEVDHEAVRGRLRGTTVGGATLLRLALDGSFPAYMLEFVDELRVSVSRAVISAVSHGESSGTDALAGFVCGLASICTAEKLDE